MKSTPRNDGLAALATLVPLDNLLESKNKEALANILKYHVVSGKMPASVVITSNIPTLQGTDLSLVVSNEGVNINDVANVIKTDFLASDGTIHVIDTVLVPPAPPDIVTNPPFTAPTKAPTGVPTVTPEEPNGVMTYGFILAGLAVTVGFMSLV